MENNNFFDKINNWIRDTEGSVVNVLSAIAPWGAPLPAAYMSFAHMNNPLVLNFPVYISIPVAAVIEILGFATVSTILNFWSYNRKYTDEKKQAPVGITVFAFCFYLSIVLIMNVLVDATTGTEYAKWAIIGVRALLTLMSIPAALVLAVRTQHQNVLHEGSNAKRERDFKKHYGDNWFEMMYGTQPPVVNPQLTGKLPVSYATTFWRVALKTMTQEDIDFINTNDAHSVAIKFGLTDRTALNWKKYAARII